MVLTMIEESSVVNETETTPAEADSESLEKITADLEKVAGDTGEVELREQKSAEIEAVEALESDAVMKMDVESSVLEEKLTESKHDILERKSTDLKAVDSDDDFYATQLLPKT